MRLAAGAALLEPHPPPRMTWALRRAPRMAAPQPRTDLRGYGLQREVDSAERKAKAAQLEEKVLRTIREHRATRRRARHAGRVLLAARHVAAEGDAEWLDLRRGRWPR